LFEPAAEEKDVRMSIEVMGDGAIVLGDPDLLFNAVSNLLDNAVKFTPSDGKVELTVRASEAEVVLSVADTGPGIPVEEREAVLRRFYRSERSRHTVGNGLGLSLVAAVARLHGFSLDIGDANSGCLVTLRGRRMPDTP
jgi:signal transduction histidine kinase